MQFVGVAHIGPGLREYLMYGLWTQGAYSAGQVWICPS